jgi:hypothetical protein
METGGQGHAPIAYPPRKGHVTHFTSGWVGPTASVDGCGKSRHTGIAPRTVQTVAGHYSDRAIPPSPPHTHTHTHTHTNVPNLCEKDRPV